jgi:hypothetical protein
MSPEQFEEGSEACAGQGALALGGPAMLRLILGVLVARAAVGSVVGVGRALRGGAAAIDEVSLVERLSSMRLGVLLLPPAEGHDSEVLAGSAPIQPKNHEHAGHAYYDLLRQRHYPDGDPNSASGDTAPEKSGGRGDDIEDEGSPDQARTYKKHPGSTI